MFDVLTVPVGANIQMLPPLDPPELLVVPTETLPVAEMSPTSPPETVPAVDTDPMVTAPFATKLILSAEALPALCRLVSVTLPRANTGTRIWELEPVFIVSDWAFMLANPAGL